MPPVAGAAFSVRDSENEDVFRFDGVEHGVGEDPRSTDMHIVFEITPTFRIGDDLRDGGPDFPGEALTKLAPAFFVELNGFLEFQKRFRMELVPHFASRRSMRR